jgi:NitT/TauT family transport system permease protein
MKTTQNFSTLLRNNSAGLLFLLAAWWGLTWFYPAYLLPSPWDVMTSVWAYLPTDFWHHVGATLFRIMAGFAVSLVAGTLLGIIAYVNKWVKPMNSVMLALQVLPGTILGVVFLLLFGTGNSAPILLAVFLTLPMLAINTVHGLSKRNLKLQQYLTSIHTDKAGMFRYCYLPALVPVIQSNLSLGLGMAVKVVIMGEFIGAQDGLGYLLNNARIVFVMKEVFFYLLLLLQFTLIFQALQTFVFSRFFQKYDYPE